MERDEYRPEGGNIDQDLEEKEGSAKTFGPGLGKTHNPKRIEGTMGDSRPDETDPEHVQFVDTSDDPNMTITRKPGDLSEVDRGPADEMAAIHHKDTRIVARPQPPLDEEGAELRPLSEEELRSAEDS